MTAPGRQQAGAEPGPETLLLREVRKVFRLGETEVRALDGVSLRVGRGEFVAVMGSSGSGKSTLMNILGCLDVPSGGSYALDGVPVTELSPRELADVRNRKIGFVFQGFNLLPRTTALENVELPLFYRRGNGMRGEARELALAALGRVGLGDRVSHVPSQLSGGQQQRVAIARALVARPAILLADEPTGNLDSHTTLEIMAHFQAFNREGLTVVMVTHEPEVAAYTGRVVELRDGRVVRDQKVARPREAAEDLEAGGRERVPVSPPREEEAAS